MKPITLKMNITLDEDGYFRQVEKLCNLLGVDQQFVFWKFLTTEQGVCLDALTLASRCNSSAVTLLVA